MRKRFSDVNVGETPKGALGERLANGLNEYLRDRLQEILPELIEKGGKVNIHANTASFWEKSPKEIVISVLVIFSDDTIWRDQ